MYVFQVMEERQRGRLQYCNGIEIQFLTLLFIEQLVDCGFEVGRCIAGTNENPEFDPT